VEQPNARGRQNTPQIGACIDRLTAIMREPGRKKGAVIKLYLSNFKSYNDSFGYAFGGMLIGEITSYLESIDGVDTYHIRGVEYILIAEIASKQSISGIADAILQRFEDTWQIDNIICACSVNAGIVYLPGAAETPNEVLEQLGTAINESAQMGANILVEYNDELVAKYQRSNVIAQHIHRAIAEDAIDMQYRPVYQVSAKRFSRIDCSAQLFCEGLGLVKELEFMAVAERSGQINAVSGYIVRKAIGLIKVLIDKGISFETVSVKISPIQLLQERFVGDLTEMITQAGIPASRLAFEVEENTANSTFSKVYMCVTELSDMGIEIILSDFGTGSLGIYNILSMSVDVVKIKRQLIWQMDNTPNGASLVEGLIHLARNFGLKLIAEGVETEEQVKLLADYGCEYQQGYYHSDFLAVNDLIELLQKEESI